jgi:hypothetical protein
VGQCDGFGFGGQFLPVEAQYSGGEELVFHLETKKSNPKHARIALL